MILLAIPDYIHVFFSETSAFMHLAPQCPLSLAFLIDDTKYDTEVPQVLDADPATCLTLAENVGQWIQISIPYVRIQGLFHISYFGNLNCNPMFGLSVSLVSDCESGNCSYLRCVAKDWVMSNAMGVCKYRCHSFSVCNHIIVDIAGLNSNAFFGTLCEIVF